MAKTSPRILGSYGPLIQNWSIDNARSPLDNAPLFTFNPPWVGLPPYTNALPSTGTGIPTFCPDYRTTPLPLDQDGFVVYANIAMSGGSGTGVVLTITTHPDLSRYPNGIYSVGNNGTGTGYKVGDLLTSDPSDTGGYTIKLRVAEVDMLEPPFVEEGPGDPGEQR